MESDFSKQLFAESWFINKESNILNGNNGVTFPSTVLPIKVIKLLVVLCLTIIVLSC